LLEGGKEVSAHTRAFASIVPPDDMADFLRKWADPRPEIQANGQNDEVNLAGWKSI
jgi:hypothetical protein